MVHSVDHTPLTTTTAGEPALATSFWGVLYADNAGVVLQSTEQLKKMMGVIMVVCMASGLTVLEAKTENLCIRMKGMTEPITMFNIEAARLVYN